MALDASVTLLSTRGARVVPLKEFYTGVRKNVMQPDELLVDISFQAMTKKQRGTFIKLALRRAQAISLVNVAIILELKEDTVKSASITLGAVTPIITHAVEAETFLAKKKLNKKNIALAAELAQKSAHPIDDVRGSAAYRLEMVKVITARGLTAILEGNEQAGMPKKPILLVSEEETETYPSSEFPASAIETTVNGKKLTFTSGHNKTLLRLLREEGMLTGTKEGCAEGECGACTVFMDGKAVMACLVPAPRAHGAHIITVEGLATQTKKGSEKLHPVQEAFVENGAVQCGYCTPGFLMSGAKLLEEKPNPTRNEIEQAITGNLCRCTGYYKIVKAIEEAAKK